VKVWNNITEPLQGKQSSLLKLKKIGVPRFLPSRLQERSSSGLSFSSLTSKSSQPVSGSEYGTAG